MSALAAKMMALAVLLAVTLTFGLVPLRLVQGAGPCALGPACRGRAQALINSFGAGVFLATCLLDLLPDYLSGFYDAFAHAGLTLQFPLAEFIVAMGFFLVLVSEQLFLAFTEEPRKLGREGRGLLVDGYGSEQASYEVDDECHPQARPLPASPSVLRASVLVSSLCLHAVFEGLAVGLLVGGREVAQVCAPLAIHKGMVALSLAFTLAHTGLRRAPLVGSLLLFASAAPVGVGAGALLSESALSARAGVARRTLEGVVAGAFIYITFMEVLPQQFGRGRRRLAEVAITLLGFTAVTAVLFVKM
ncbi:zinc transporter ZIP1 [Hippocampus comes]|uniref:Solute carrier family 39 member 1 n=1 Tax=Hippocampus comes TaxID=109280 RepID=A0A3Q3DX13_HIPCM|nr:PREDICTED: zinc transporter ZIP1 [Hippocampus comes]XP_019719244.1 PREDICTED: zinc transporter ZIP1 [Hippocampus comes]